MYPAWVYGATQALSAVEGKSSPAVTYRAKAPPVTYRSKSEAVTYRAKSRPIGGPA